MVPLHTTHPQPSIVPWHAPKRWRRWGNFAAPGPDRPDHVEVSAIRREARSGRRRLRRWGCSGEIIASLAARSFVEPGVHKLAANSLLDTLDSQVFMAYFRRAGLYRTADIKPVFPDARLNRFKGVFYPFVIHGAHRQFAPQSWAMNHK